MVKGFHLLIIEEDEGLRSVIRHLCEGVCTITFKLNVEDAWRWLQIGHIPDLLIADISVRDQICTDFVKGLLNSSFYENIPIILIKEPGEVFLEERSTNIKAIFNKPFDPIDLKKTIENSVYYE